MNIQEHITYSLATNVTEICEPLFKHLNINYFDYAHFYPDQTAMILYTDPEYVNFFLHHIAYKPTPPKMVNYGQHLWESYIEPDFLLEAKNVFNHAHGITIRIQCDGYDEVVNFATTPDNRIIHDFYLNKKSLINKFIYYFKERAKPLIKVASRNRFDLTEQNYDTTAPDYTDLYKDIENELFDTDNQVLTIDDKIIKLTPRESQCLSHLMQGKTSKMIARILKISPRTVECYCDAIKEKLGCNTRLEVITRLQAINIVD